jgi:nucleotide-binding universal stress UspA family protein
MDRIMLATDFSPAAEKAAGYAQALAKRFSSNVTLTHVIDLSYATPAEETFVGLFLANLRRETAENQDRLLAKMVAAGVRARVQTMESYNPAVALVGLGKELRTDLIVTGTNGRRGLSKAILGSFAEGVIRQAVCPVLTIGPQTEPVPAGGFAFRSVVFATDFSSNMAVEAAVALSFAQDSVANIYLCHVLDRPGKDICQTVDLELKFEEALQSLIPRSTYDWCCPERVLETGEVAPGILALAKRFDADLIVLGAKHSGTWYSHLVDGTVGQVLTKAECPVLTVCSS